MNVDVRPRIASDAQTRLGVVDCDIHPMLKNAKALLPFLSERWRTHHETYGNHFKHPFPDTTPYPRSQPALSRRDSWPPSGGPPGSDLAFMREQHLDPNDIDFGLLQVLFPTAASQRNLDYGLAMSRALNDWQVAEFCEPERRLRGSVIVPQEDAPASIAEIERCAASGYFSQVFIAPRIDEPLGRRRYWPILEAAARAGLPLGMHSGGYNGHASMGGGWPSFYVEEHHAGVQSAQALITSLVFEGVFERIPDLKVVIIEVGFAFLPAFAWRLDQHWARLRSEVPHVKRPPSEYIREHFWFTTQPMDEPERPEDLRHTLDWIGWDRILFATDYPHWDYDDPARAITIKLSETERKMVFRDNAMRLYGLD